jgi:diaminopimelate epimerase
MDSHGALRLTKHHGAGNDFLVLLDPEDRRPLSAAEVRALCDRHRGIGADGVVRVVSGAGPAALAMDLRNADGSLAEMSGNGIRCLVQAAVDAGVVGAGSVVVATLAGLRTVEYRPGPGPGQGYGRVEMGHAALGPELEDTPAGWRWAQHVGMGNPHVVLFGLRATDDAVHSIGPGLERSVAGGANVEFVWPGPVEGELTLRVWERGIGETLACGTGACAAVAAAHAHHDIGTRVRVHNPGGPLDVELDDAGVFLAGPTQTVGEVRVDAEVLAGLLRSSGLGSEAGGEAVPRQAHEAVATEVATRR